MNAETALLLLELDKSLASLKDKNQISTLQLLAEMPAAFESEFPMGVFERLIYYCMPTPTTLLDLTILPIYSCLNTMDIHIHIYVYNLNSKLCCRPGECHDEESKRRHTQIFKGP
jgi:hypothetical protein